MEAASAAEVIEPIRVRVYDELRRRGSVFATGEELNPEFDGNLVAIVTETAASILTGRRPDAVAVDYGDDAELAHTGRLRASEHAHPAESLMAAEVLFDVALPIFAAAGSNRATAEDVVLAAQALHHAIWRRFPPGAIAYAEALRQQVSAVHQESRARVSRDLHDRIAPAIASARLRLGAAERGSDIATNLRRADDALQEAMVDVRGIAAELRLRVGGSSLSGAVRRLVEEIDSPHPVTVSEEGEPWSLPSWAAEETFEILVEAVRNARYHSQGTVVTVHLLWTAQELVAAVRDDGTGFDVAEAGQGRLGLATMRERARVLGGQLDIASSPVGSAVRLSMPRPIGAAGGAVR